MYLYWSGSEKGRGINTIYEKAICFHTGNMTTLAIEGYH